MGFISACQPGGLGTTLAAGEILTLAILGTAARGPTARDLIGLAVEAVTGRRLRPDELAKARA